MRNKIVFEIFIFYYQRYKGRQPWGPWHTQDMVYLTPSPSCPIHHPSEMDILSIFHIGCWHNLCSQHIRFYPLLSFQILHRLNWKWNILSYLLNNYIHMLSVLHMTFHSIIQLLHQSSYEFFCFYIMLMSKYNTLWNKKSIFFLSYLFFFKLKSQYYFYLLAIPVIFCILIKLK